MMWPTWWGEAPAGLLIVATRFSRLPGINRATPKRRRAAVYGAVSLFHVVLGKADLGGLATL